MLNVRLNTPLTLDPKGRITLPSRVKAALDAERTNALVCIAHNGHLRLYTSRDFEERVEKPLLELDAFDPEVEKKQRLRLGRAVEVQFDLQGRFVVPPNLRAMAGLERDVVLISLADRLEIWEQGRLDAWFARADQEGGGA